MCRSCHNNTVSFKGHFTPIWKKPPLSFCGYLPMQICASIPKQWRWREFCLWCSNHWKIIYERLNNTLSFQKQCSSYSRWSKEHTVNHFSWSYLFLKKLFLAPSLSLWTMFMCNFALVTYFHWKHGIHAIHIAQYNTY